LLAVSHHDTYVRLLRRIMAAELPMRTGSVLDYECATAPVPAAYLTADVAQIVVRAQPGDYLWLEEVGPDAFAAGAADPLVECIIVAHEFGHHLSTRAQANPARYNAVLDEVRWRMGTEQPPEDWHRSDPASRDGDAMYAEEVAAWINAKHELTEVGFTEWAAFDEQQTEKLHGYRVGIAAKIPGWAPTP
jgi:hypothetical protein